MRLSRTKVKESYVALHLKARKSAEFRRLRAMLALSHPFRNGPMAEEHESLILDLVEWVASKPRRYSEVMEAWRTSCPRLPVWEDAVDRGLVERKADGTADSPVAVTPAGRDYLKRNGRDLRKVG